MARKDDIEGDVRQLGNRRSLPENHDSRKTPKDVGTCNALKTNGSGDRCSRVAGWGTDHLGWGRCKNHTGSTAAGKVAAAKERLASHGVIMGEAVDIEPTEALLGEVRRTAGHVMWLQAMIQRFDEDLEGQDAQKVLMSLSESGWNRASWVKLYQDERLHLAKTAKMALDAGVAERTVKMAEKQGELIATALRGILRDLGLTPEQEQAAPDIVARHLRAVS